MVKSPQKLPKVDFFNPIVKSKPPDALGIRDMVFRVGTQGFCSRFLEIQMLLTLKQNSNC